MKYIEKYTGEKTYMYPNAELATPTRVLQDFPAALQFPHIVETDESGQVLFAIMNLAAMRSQFGIDSLLSEEEAIQAIEDIMNTESEPVTDAQTEALENIAAQLEYKNMVATDTATE